MKSLKTVLIAGAIAVFVPGLALACNEVLCINASGTYGSYSQHCLGLTYTNWSQWSSESNHNYWARRLDSSGSITMEHFVYGGGYSFSVASNYYRKTCQKEGQGASSATWWMSQWACGPDLVTACY